MELSYLRGRAYDHNRSKGHVDAMAKLVVDPDGDIKPLLYDDIPRNRDQKKKKNAKRRKKPPPSDKLEESDVMDPEGR